MQGSISINGDCSRDISTGRYDYQRYLERRQKEHLESVFGRPNSDIPCLHDSCPECIGTGIKRDGSMCVHNIACSCPKCSPSF